MMFDNLDFFIINEIFDASAKKGGVTSTWIIAKKFKWEDQKVFLIEKEKHFYISLKSNLVSKRLKRMKDEGFIRIDKENGRKIYTLLPNRVMKQMHKFPEGYRKTILIKEKNNKWCAFQI